MYVCREKKVAMPLPYLSPRNDGVRLPRKSAKPTRA